MQGVAIAFSAALLLIFASISHYHRQGEADTLANLGACFGALEELGASWESAKRARDFLVRLRRHWEIQAMSNSIPHRGSFAASASPMSRKRRRTLSGSNDDRSQSHLSESPRVPGSSRGADDLGIDLDIDWMLAADAQGLPGSWGNFFSLPSGDMIPNRPNQQ